MNQLRDKFCNVGQPTNHSDREDEFLKSQMAEAWAHYRHCETVRAQYLSFFFTGYTAVAGFVVTLLKPDEKTQLIADSTLVGVASFLFVLFWVSACFYILIVRLNAVLGHYARIMDQTRKHFFAADGFAIEIWSYRKIGLHEKKPSIFSVGVSIPRLLAGLSLCLISCEALLTAVLAQRTRISWQTTLSLSFSIVTLTAWIYLIVKAHDYQKRVP